MGNSRTVDYDRSGKESKESWETTLDFAYNSSSLKSREAGYSSADRYPTAAVAPAAPVDGMGILLCIIFALPFVILALMARFPILEFAFELFMYICACRYVLKKRRYKRTGDEKDKPSKLSKIVTKILVVLFILYLILEAFSLFILLSQR